MKTDRFHLEIVPLKNILTHEEFDPTRSSDLINKLKKSNLLTEPIIAASLGNGQYLQLDGMNRLNCFQANGVKDHSRPGCRLQ